MLKFRKATLDDLSEIEKIYEGARAFMRETGNPTQWGTAYPSRDVILSDIEKGELYVAYDAVIEAVFVFCEGDDPEYKSLDGKWLSDRPSRAVHRVASAGLRRGILSYVMNFCFSHCESIKIDTHRDNTVMQKALERYGFSPCGTVFIKGAGERTAYQMIK